MSGKVLSQRLAAGLGALGGRRPRKVVCRGWRLAPGGEVRSARRTRGSELLFENLAPGGGT